MRDPKKKCIAKKCEDCQFYQPWDMTDEKTGLRKQKMECCMQILFEEIPRIRGAVDGCQQATNETKNSVFKFGRAAIETLQHVGDIKYIEDLK